MDLMITIKKVSKEFSSIQFEFSKMFDSTFVITSGIAPSIFERVRKAKSSLKLSKCLKLRNR